MILGEQVSGCYRAAPRGAELSRSASPGQDPINRRIAWTGDALKFIGLPGDWRTVVGVVGDTGTRAPTGRRWRPSTSR